MAIYVFKSEHDEGDYDSSYHTETVESILNGPEGANLDELRQEFILLLEKLQKDEDTIRKTMKLTRSEKAKRTIAFNKTVPNFNNWLISEKGFSKLEFTEVIIWWD